MDNDKYRHIDLASSVPDELREMMRSDRSPTGRILIVGGDSHISRELMRGLVEMGHHATVAMVPLEMNFADAERRVVTAMKRDGLDPFQAIYGRDRLHAVAAEPDSEPPKKNDPWYRRESRGGRKSKRRW